MQFIPNKPLFVIRIIFTLSALGGDPLRYVVYIDKKHDRSMDRSLGYGRGKTVIWDPARHDSRGCW